MQGRQAANQDCSYLLDAGLKKVTVPPQNPTQNLPHIFPQPALFQADFTFQSSHFRIGQFLFKLGLTRDSFIFISIPGQETRLSYYRNTPSAPSASQEPLGILHGVHCVLNDLDPAVALFFGAGMDFHHFGIFSTHADQEQTLLFMSHFSYNQLLQRDHSGFLVLQTERNGWGGWPVLAPRFKLTLKWPQKTIVLHLSGCKYFLDLLANYKTKIISVGSNNRDGFAFLQQFCRKSNFTSLHFKQEWISTWLCDFANCTIFSSDPISYCPHSPCLISQLLTLGAAC